VRQGAAVAIPGSRAGRLGDPRNISTAIRSPSPLLKDDVGAGAGSHTAILAPTVVRVSNEEIGHGCNVPRPLEGFGGLRGGGRVLSVSVKPAACGP